MALTVLDQQHLDAILWPPALSPATSYGQDTSYKLNNLRSTQFQFAYRYVYDNYGKSCLSPYSKVIIPPEEELVNGDFVDDVTVNNYIKLALKWGHESVAKLELFVRQGNTRDWSLYDRISRPDVQTFTLDFNATYYGVVSGNTKFSDLFVGMGFKADGTYFTTDYYITRLDPVNARFYVSAYPATGAIVSANLDTDNVYSIFKNDTVLEAQDQADLARPFDYVPLASDALALIDGNKLTYGGNTEGYDPTDIDVVLTSSVSVAPYAISDSVMAVTNVLNGSKYDISVTFTTDANTKFYILTVVTDWGTHIAPVLFKSTDTVTNIVVKFWEIVSEWYAIDPNFTIAVGTIYRNPTVSGTVLNFSILASSSAHSATCYGYSVSQKYALWEWGARHNFGIEYLDRANRSSAVSVSTKSILQVPWYGNVYANPNIYNTLSWQIKHAPPSWATHWQWVYGGCDKYVKVQTIINGFKNTTRVDILPDSSTGKIKIYINKNLQTWIDGNKKVIIPLYNFEKGDRIRFIAYRGTGSTSWQNFTDNYTNPASNTVYIDREITSVDYDSGDGGYVKDTAATPAFITDADGNKVRQPSGLYITVDAFDYTGLTSYGWGTAEEMYLVEIYRNVPLGNVYHEIGEVYEIGQDAAGNTIHKGTVDQSFDSSGNLLTAASGTIDSGNVYLRPRYIDTTIFPAVDNNESDYYSSESTDIGRTNIVNPNIRQIVKKKAIRFGGSWYANSTINNLNRFAYEDEVPLEDRFGNVTALQQVGFVLKALQQSKETSIYVGRLETYNQDGTKNLIATDKTLGTIRASETVYGTIFPHSVIQFDGSLYFFDVYAGMIFRDAGGGQIPISSYKMRAFFKDLCAALVKDGVDSVNVVGFVNYQQALVGWQITDSLSEENNYVITFSPKTNRWTSYHQYCDVNGNYPSFYGNITNNLMIGFLNGVPYLHESDEVNRCYFYDHQYSSTVEVVSNIHPDMIKRFESLEEQADGVWAAPTVGDIYIDPDETNNYGMSSRLSSGQFKLQEGAYRAAFLRDMTTRTRKSPIVSSWPLATNSYDTLTTAANLCDITSLIKTTTTGDSSAQSASFSILAYDLIVLDFTLTVNSGLAPHLYLIDESGTKYSDVYYTRPGLNRIRINVGNTSGYRRIMLVNGAGESFNGSLVFSDRQIVRPNVSELHTGRVLRGKYITLRLTNTNTYQTQLQFVNVFSSGSR